MKRISFSDDAKANIRAIPRHLAMNILTAIHRLADSGAGRVKRLHDMEGGEMRLRVGDYRVRYTETVTAVRILAVKNRKDAYRRD